MIRILLILFLLFLFEGCSDTRNYFLLNKRGNDPSMSYPGNKLIIPPTYALPAYGSVDNLYEQNEKEVAKILRKQGISTSGTLSSGFVNKASLSSSDVAFLKAMNALEVDKTIYTVLEKEVQGIVKKENSLILKILMLNPTSELSNDDRLKYYEAKLSKKK